MTGLPKHWSPSAHRAYRTCPRQFWLEYVARVGRTDSPESVRGQVMHAGMAAGWGGAALVAMNHEADRLGLPDSLDPEFSEWTETVYRALARLGPEPGDELLGAELELRSECDGVPLKARLDLVFRRDGILRIYDWKSASELPRREEVRRNTQLGLGAFLAAREYGTDRIKVAIASIGSGVACEVDMPPDMAEAAARRVAETARRAQVDTEFAPVRGEACADCKVRKFCPLFAAAGTVIPAPAPEPAR